MRKIWSGMALLTCAMTLRASQPPDRWLHIRVKDSGARGESVVVNVPLSLAESVLPTIKSDDLHAGRVRISNCSVNGVDLRALWQAVREAGDSEFVTVDSPNEKVRVSKKDGFMLINVRDRGREYDRGEQKVDIKIPVPVVNALLSGPKDQLDLEAGLRALRTYGDTSLVSVDDNSETVRIWVDARNGSDD